MSMRPQSNTTVVRGAVIAAVLLVLGGALFWRIRHDGGSATPGTKTENPAAGSSLAPGESAPPGESTSLAPPVTPAPPNPATINVVVANGAKVKGAASRVSSELQAKGFVSLGTTNAKTVSQTSSVLYQGDQIQNATYVAKLLGIPVEAVLPAAPMPEFSTAIGPEVGVIVIIGKDLAQPTG
jgi:hypothetical protein